MWKLTTEGGLEFDDRNRVFEQAEHARFLFPGSDIEEFIQEVIKESSEHESHKRAQEASGHQTQESSAAALGLIELDQKLSAKRDRIHIVFEPYLRFKL